VDFERSSRRQADWERVSLEEAPDRARWRMTVSVPETHRSVPKISFDEMRPDRERGLRVVASSIAKLQPT